MAPLEMKAAPPGPREVCRPARLAPPPSNVEIAASLEDLADLLHAQSANPFRVAAYRNGARTVRDFPKTLTGLLEAGGRGELERLPGIGRSLASAIEELALTGRLRLLERLRGEVTPEALFASIPGVGSTLARRAHANLGIDTLEELELAAHDGRLERVPGFGPRRARALREILGAVLGRTSRRRARLVVTPLQQNLPLERPSVALLFEIDWRYRELAGAGKLPMIAPRRFNPTGARWLPILHTDREGWHFTALFSNSATAHRLGKNGDWVVLYWERDGDEAQATAVTATRGVLAGRRVVRGREAECSAHYAVESSAPTATPRTLQEAHHDPA